MVATNNYEDEITGDYVFIKMSNGDRYVLKDVNGRLEIMSQVSGFGDDMVIRAKCSNVIELFHATKS